MKTDIPDGRIEGAGPSPKDESELHEFRWGDDDEIVSLQCPIAVYRNPSGDIVIRQDQTGMMGEDVWIVLSTEDAVRALVRSLQREIGDQ